jgi:uncharacterized protein DUF1707
MTTKEVATTMPAQASPPSNTGTGSGYRRHFRYGGSDLRASDAERAEVADRLSRHYQEGRLDQAEFNERLDRAMNAKTRGDFAGLFADLPDLAQDSQPAGPGQPARIPHVRRPGPPLARLFPIAAIVIIAIIVTHAVIHSWLLWLVVGGLAFVWLRGEEHRRRR